MKRFRKNHPRLTKASLPGVGFELESLEARRLMAAVVVTPIQIPAHTESTVVIGNRALFYSSYYSPTPTGGIYDPITGVLTPISSPAGMASGNTVTSNNSVTTVGSKTIFAGGINPISSPQMLPMHDASDDVYIYDQTTAQWSSGHLSAPRGDITALNVGDKAVFAGGYPSAGPGGPIGASDVVDIYNNSTGTWTTGHLSKPTYYMATAVVAQKAYFVTIYNQNTQHHALDIFDAESGQWSTIEVPVQGFIESETAVGNKIVFLAESGGHQDGPRSVRGTLIAEVYDTQTNRWSTHYLGQSAFDPNIAVKGNQAVFLGGDTRDVSGPNTGFRIARVFDARTGAWSTSRPPRAIGRSATTAVSLGKDIVFVASNSLEIYHPSTSSWSVIDAPVHGSGGAVLQVVGRRIFSYYNGYSGRTGGADIISFVDSAATPRPVITNPASGTSVNRAGAEFRWSSTPHASMYDVLVDGVLSANVKENVWSPGYSITAGPHSLRVRAYVNGRTVEGPTSDFELIT
jgi:hypothetical protein